MFSKKLTTIISLGLLTGLAACMGNFVNPDDGKAEENDQRIRQYIISNQLQDKALRTNTGLYYIVNTSVPTTARRPSLGEEVQFTYMLSTLDGRRVDSATTAKPVFMPFGIGAVIAGLEEGLSLMREGESYSLLIPSQLAFGGEVKSGIPAYSPVRFDVRLVRSRTEEQQVREYIADSVAARRLTFIDSLSVPSAAGRTFVFRTATGTGAQLKKNDRVTVNYSGKLLRSGREFDKNSSGSFAFTIDGGEVIPGFNNGVSALRVGDKATIIFPSSAGYGSRGQFNQSTGIYVIPPYSALRFDVEIVKVQ